MPTLETATRNIQHLVDLPRERLRGWSISQLANEFGTGLKWLTGSTVWLPAVFGDIHEDTDTDIVFETKEACELFLKGVMSVLDGYKLTSNTWGSGRVTHPDGKHVIDAWHLDGDESIAELLLTYPHDYQRCAYSITWAGASPSNLTRVVKARTRIRESRGVYRRVRAVGTTVHNDAIDALTRMLDEMAIT